MRHMDLHLARRHLPVRVTTATVAAPVCYTGEFANPAGRSDIRRGPFVSSTDGKHGWCIHKGGLGRHVAVDTIYPTGCGYHIVVLSA